MYNFGNLDSKNKKMATVKDIRNGLIDKLLTINNKEFLKALDTLISSETSNFARTKLTEEQKFLLEMSEQDIKNGKLISQEAMNQRNMEWLDQL